MYLINRTLRVDNLTITKKVVQLTCMVKNYYKYIFFDKPLIPIPPTSLTLFFDIENLFIGK